MDRVHQPFVLKESGLIYRKNERSTCGCLQEVLEDNRVYYKGHGYNMVFPMELVHIEEVVVEDCDSDYIKTVVIPDLAAIGLIDRLVVINPTEILQKLVAAAKQDDVRLGSRHPQ